MDEFQWNPNAGKLRSDEVDQIVERLFASPVVDEEQVPEGFLVRRELVEVNKDAIRSRLEAGEELPFAQLGDRGRRINIR